jgi:hypothetical protein
MAPHRFGHSDEFREQTEASFETHESRIHQQIPSLEIRLRGGCSVSGVLTTGDVDIHVRVDSASFEPALATLSELYEPFHRDAWTPGSAFFFAPDSQPSVEIALTVIGTLDDLHHGEAWDRIAADRSLIAEYNALKRAHEGGSLEDYNAAKRAFFYDNF